MDGPPRYRRPLKGQSRLSKRMRGAVIHPEAILDIVRSVEIFSVLQQANLVGALVQVFDEALLSAQDSVGAHIFHRLTYSDDDVTPRRAPRTLIPKWTSVTAAVTEMGTLRNFTLTFGLTPSEARYFSKLLFPDDEVIRVRQEWKQGFMTREEATLMILHGSAMSMQRRKAWALCVEEARVLSRVS